jgi:hypothetical protein
VILRLRSEVGDPKNRWTSAPDPSEYNEDLPGQHRFPTLTDLARTFLPRSSDIFPTLRHTGLGNPLEFTLQPAMG